MALSAQGIVFRFSSVTGITTALGSEVGECVDFSFGTPAVSMIDVSHFGSTQETKVPGIAKGSQLSLTVNYVATDVGQLAMRQAAISTVQQSLMILFPDTGKSRVSLEGYVSDFQISGGVNDKLKAAITFDINQSSWGTYT